MWFDTDAATAATRSWATWGDRLEVDSRAIRFQLDSLALAGWSGGTDALDAAGDDLWTLAAFVNAVRSTVLRADGSFPTTSVAVAALWNQADRLVAMSAGYRDAVADAAARERFLAGLDASDVRTLFEGVHGDDPARVLAGLDGPDAVAYWEALTASEQNDLVEMRPDLVVLRVLDAGAELPLDVLRELDISNSYATFNEEIAFEFEAAVNLRVVAIEVGGGLTAITTKMSDGTVELTLVEEANVGVGVDLDVPNAGGAGASVGVFGELQQRFRFADEGEASAAIGLLKDAVREDASFGELVRDGSGLLWNVATTPWNAPANVTNWIIPVWDPVPTIPTYDFTPETIRRLQELWASNGLTKQEGGGVYANVSAEFDANLGIIEAELDADADARLMFYDTDVAEADTTGATGQTGVMFAGTASVDVDGEVDGLGHDLAGHAAAEAGFVVDLHHVDDAGTFVTVTVHTTVAAGAAVELVDLGAAELDSTVDGTAAMTVVFTVPVDGDTTDVVGDLGLGLAQGRFPSAEFGELYDRAEIDVTITTGITATTEAELELAVVEANASVTASEETTQVALHKYPDGELFSRIDVDRLIDEAVQ